MRRASKAPFQRNSSGSSYYWMRHASCDAPRILWCATHPVMRHASCDAPRILWCTTHQVKSTAGNALNDKLYSDAPRINRCAAHRNLALPEYKRDWEELFSISLPILSVRPFFSDLVPEIWKTHFPLLRDGLSCSEFDFFAGFDGSDFYAWFEKNWRRGIAGFVDQVGNGSSTGFSFLFLFSFLDFRTLIVRMTDLAMSG